MFIYTIFEAVITTRETKRAGRLLVLPFLLSIVYLQISSQMDNKKSAVSGSARY